MSIEQITDMAVALRPVVLGLLARLVLAIAIFVVGRWLANLIKRLVKRIMTRAQVEPTLMVFATNILFYCIMTFVAIAALGQLGIETTSLVAAIGAAGLAIGLALQGSLTNFAAGIIVIIFRPLQVGDWIEVEGYSGHVVDIQLLSTVIETLNHRTVVMPNGKLTSNSLVNYSTSGRLRLDLVIGVDYATDIDRVKQILMEVLTGHEQVLKEPQPTVGLLEMADSSLNFAVRPWVAPKDYLRLEMAIQELIKKRFDAEGITIPFPQRDVHLIQPGAGAQAGRRERLENN